MRDTVERTGIHQEQIHQPVTVVIQPAPTRAVRFEDVRNFCIAELVDEIDARLGGDILEQIIWSGRDRRSDGQRRHQWARCAGDGFGELSFDGDGGQRQNQTNRDDGGEPA